MKIKEEDDSQENDTELNLMKLVKLIQINLNKIGFFFRSNHAVLSKRNRM